MGVPAWLPVRHWLAACRRTAVYLGICWWGWWGARGSNP